MTIYAHFHIPDEAYFSKDKHGDTVLVLPVELGDTAWLRFDLNGTNHHNSAAIVIKNLEDEESVTTRISVADPRGAFVMYTEANETGHYLSVPHPDESLPHVDELEEKGRGYYKMHLPPLNREEEEG